MFKSNQIIVFILSLVFVLAACEKIPTPYEKPKKLIKEKQMINMLVDMHMAESTYTQFQNDSTIKKSSSSVFYYSILNKYHVTDSVFEKSFVYYASNPRNFEKMYMKVNEIEQDYSDRKEDALEFDDPARVR